MQQDPTLVRFLNTGGRDVWVNPAHVVGVERVTDVGKPFVAIHVRGGHDGGQTFAVQGTTDEVAFRISQTSVRDEFNFPRNVPGS